MYFLRYIITSGSQYHWRAFYFNLRALASVLIIWYSSTSIFSNSLIWCFIIPRSNIIFWVVVHHLFLEKMLQTNHIMSIVINFVTKSKVSRRNGRRRYVLVHYFIRLTAIWFTSQDWIIIRVRSHDTLRTIIQYFINSIWAIFCLINCFLCPPRSIIWIKIGSRS